jgi:hypothetical protein
LRGSCSLQLAAVGLENTQQGVAFLVLAAEQGGQQCRDVGSQQNGALAFNLVVNGDGFPLEVDFRVLYAAYRPEDLNIRFLLYRPTAAL